MATDPTNLLLEALPAEEHSQMIACTELVNLLLREPLYVAGTQPKYAYFITGGIASVVTSMADGTTAEVGIIGREGLTGATHLLGALPNDLHCFMQVAGSARRLPFSMLQGLFDHSLPIHARVLQYVQLGYLSTSQFTACNATHTVEQRLSRWLLMVHDRVLTDDYLLTHEFLAEMLVTHRPTVSVAAAILQKNGLIRYRHGHICIMNRAGLEALACECYQVTNNLLRDLYS